MSIVAEGLIDHLKAEMNRTGGLGYDNAYRIVRQALERATGALEQIDQTTKHLKFKVEVINE